MIVNRLLCPVLSVLSYHREQERKFPGKRTELIQLFSICVIAYFCGVCVKYLAEQGLIRLDIYIDLVLDSFDRLREYMEN